MTVTFGTTPTKAFVLTSAEDGAALELAPRKDAAALFSWGIGQLEHRQGMVNSSPYSPEYFKWPGSDACAVAIARRLRVKIRAEVPPRIPSKWRDKTLDEIVSEHLGGTPGRRKFGAFFQDPSGYGDAGGFSWFNTLQDLQDYLVFIEPFWLDSGDDHVGAWDRKINAFLLRRGERAFAPAGLKELDQLLPGHIEWLGTVDSLAKSRDPFARRLRAEFLELEDDEGPVRAIRPSEVRAWRAFLAEYCVG